jgi:hypothetical protein
VVDRARVGSYLRLRGLAEDGVREGAKGVGRRRAVRGAVVLARDEVAHRHLRCLLRRTGPLADAGWVVTRALLRPPATKSSRLEGEVGGREGERKDALRAWTMESSALSDPIRENEPDT